MRYVVVLICLVAALAGCQKPQPVYKSRYAPLLSDRPYVIAVLGDSTGALPGAWTYLLSRGIADAYNRTVTVHNWSIETNSYTETQTFGSGAPVTVWNGSARGKSAQYSLKWLPQMAPEPADLTIINHTHNNPWHAVEGISQLVDSAYRNTRGGAVAVMLQNPRTDDGERAEMEQQVIDRLRTIYSAPESRAVVVDVNTAFKGGDLSVLLKPDGAHPSEKGSRLWADTLVSTLGL